MKFFYIYIALPLAHSYITHPGAVPPNKQIPYLQKLTGVICDSPILSDEMIKSVPMVIEGWATSKQHSAENAVAVERLIKRLVDESEAGNEKAAPTTVDYNLMLEGWARSGEGVFAAERCEQILTQMQVRYEEGDSNVKPNLSSFKVVVMAWRQAQTSYSAVRAQQMLEWMVALYTEGKNDLALPDSDCFDIVLQCFARSRLADAPRRAEQLLGMMEKLHQTTNSPLLRPRTLSFNAVLSSWQKSDSPEALQRSLDILAFMEKLHTVEGNTRVAPDLVTYHIVLGALAKSEDGVAKHILASRASTADDILRSIQKKHKDGALVFKPDAILFNSAIGLWAKSHQSGAFRKARSLLDRQLHLFNDGCKECQPDVFGFTSVISSCASEAGGNAERQKAFNVAVSTFQQLQSRSSEYGEPNHVTYGTMLKACARLLPQGCSERSRWTEKIFEDCVSRGLVGDMVLSKLREATTNEEFKTLMQGYTKRTIPKSWSHSVHEKSEYRRKATENNDRRRAAV
jgi:hypothetical protein